jgi:ribosome-associated heat shock protein Hsp15
MASVRSRRAWFASAMRCASRVARKPSRSILGIGNRRGPASVAQTLYSESEASRQRREAERATRAAERAGYHAPDSKPDKRARRLIRALGDIDAL